MNCFKNQTVIVTGGTRGIGLGICKAFLEAGADVIVCSRHQPELLPSVNGKSPLFFQADIRQAKQSQLLIDFACSQTGKLNVLINNAGGSPEIESKSASPNFTQSIIALNLIAPAVLSQQAYIAMQSTKTTQQPQGSIINIASVSAQRPSPRTSAYGAAKAGLVNLTRSLAQEWAPDVRVNVIIAGLTKTAASVDHYGGEQGIQNIEKNMPMQRMATPEDIAKSCLYLASAQANYVSGATLEVHGGGEPPAFLSLSQPHNS